MIPRSATLSICIPAYRRVEYLKRLLDSIAAQSFKDFEVIITDDSPGTEVHDLSQCYKDKFTVLYFKNPVTLGTPSNWNEAIKHARGEWIKLMHDDDWFADRDALATFAHRAKQHNAVSFFYSAHTDVFQDGKERTVRANSFRRKKLLQNPVTLFSKNIVGPPSVTLVRNDQQLLYDESVRWVVDIDYYMQCLERSTALYINVPLVKVGIHSNQVTRESFGVASVEIPENFYLLNKVGVANLKEVLIYDAWWRLMRNLRITSVSKIREAGYEGEIHSVIVSMLTWQSRIPFFILKVGPLSKFIMLIHYFLNRRLLK